MEKLIKVTEAKQLAYAMFPDPILRTAANRLLDDAPAADAVPKMTEKEYTQIMNRLFLESESVCGDEMVYLETVGDVIRDVCMMDEERRTDGG